MEDALRKTYSTSDSDDVSSRSPIACLPPTDDPDQESSYVISQGDDYVLVSPEGWSFGDEISVALIPDLEATLTFTFTLSTQFFECQEDFIFTPSCGKATPCRRPDRYETSLCDTKITSTSIRLTSK